MSLDTDRSPQPPGSQPPADPPWGVGATLAWTVTAFAISMVIATLAFGLWSAGRPQPSLTYDGVVIAFGTFASVPVQIAVLGFAAQLRRWPPVLYLGLVVPRRAEIIVAAVAVIALNLAFDAILFISGRDVVPPFQVEVWRSAAEAGWLVAMIVAIVIVAPIGEEIAFRGFLFRGWARPGWELHAIAAIALAWALLHIQYDWLGMVQIFIAGLVLGWFRWATGSTILTIGMHVLINCQSMLETWIKLEFFP
jgi:membrane protease YdiL (CAAX protease family)